MYLRGLLLSRRWGGRGGMGSALHEPSQAGGQKGHVWWILSGCRGFLTSDQRSFSSETLLRKKKKRTKNPKLVSKNTVDLSGCFFYPCKINTDGRSLQGGSGCGGAEPAPGPYLHIPVQTPCLLYSHVMSVLFPVGCCISQISCCFVLLFLIISSVTPGWRFPTANIL